MLEVLLIGVAAGMVVAVAVIFFAIHRYQRHLKAIVLRQEGWERAQEARQQQWQAQQEKRTNELEKKVAAQVQEVQNDWQHWTEQDATRVTQMQQRYQAMAMRGSIEYELAHLPGTGEAALPLPDEDAKQTRYTGAARLSNANLSGHDLSRRSLVHADLRGACLMNANLYMADLSGASLVNANLSGADLSGANLSGADLRDAIVTGANVLVTDMNGTVLLGANLRKARNLTMEQLNSAVYDRTTLHDVEPDVTLPRIPRIIENDVRTPATSATSTSQEASSDDSPQTPQPLPLKSYSSETFDTTIPIPKQNGRKHAKVG